MQSEQPTPSTSPDHTVPDMAGDALQRRRLLLKGLGKGSAVVAVVVPIQTLAAGALPSLCTVSGVQSNVGSARTGIKTNECYGYAPAYYSDISKWPNTGGGGNGNPSNTVDGIPFSKNTSYSTIFGGTIGTGLLSILTNSPASNEAVWITALLNAFKNPIGFNYPYTPTQVRAYATNADPVVRSNALAFFKGYVQGVTA